MVPNSWTRVLLYCWPSLSLLSLNPSDDSCSFLRKERGDLDLHFKLSISSLSEGNLLDDLGIQLWDLRVKDFDHFMCSCHCIRCIGLSYPRLYVEVKFEKLITLGLCSRELVTLGCIVYPRRLVVPRKSSCCEASDKLWKPPIKLWR